MRKCKIVLALCILFICIITQKTNAEEKYEIYGTTSITAKVGDTIDLTDKSNALYRTFARVKNGETLLVEIEKVFDKKTKLDKTATVKYSKGEVIIRGTGYIRYIIKDKNGTKLGEKDVPINVDDNNRNVQKTLYT